MLYPLVRILIASIFRLNTSPQLAMHNILDTGGPSMRPQYKYTAYIHENLLTVSTLNNPLFELCPSLTVSNNTLIAKADIIDSYAMVTHYTFDGEDIQEIQLFAAEADDQSDSFKCSSGRTFSRTSEFTFSWANQLIKNRSIDSSLSDQVPIVSLVSRSNKGISILKPVIPRHSPDVVDYTGEKCNPDDSKTLGLSFRIVNCDKTQLSTGSLISLKNDLFVVIYTEAIDKALYVFAHRLLYPGRNLRIEYKTCLY